MRELNKKDLTELLKLFVVMATAIFVSAGHSNIGKHGSI
jgi:hypothetical protein